MFTNIKISKTRIQILKKILPKIEKTTKTKISIDEEVSIKGESLGVWVCKNIINAVARGFKPEDAFKLLDENYAFILISLPKNKKQLKRIKSRIIGTKGKCKKNIQAITNTIISVHGKTVAIIGENQNVSNATKAIEKLIEGKSHRFVYQFLEEMYGRI